MGIGHNHSSSKTTHERSLLFALILTSIFLLVEVIGGIVTQSLALISDAGHMLTDVTALVISLVAIKIGRRPADLNRTFGYYRFEILAATFNTTLLFLVAVYIIYEAWQRLSHPPEIHSMGMIMIASVGLIVNLVSMRLLTSGKDKNMNMKSAYLEVWSDMLGSIGVIMGAAIIYLTGWKEVDSIIAVLIGIWVLPRTFILLKDSINILLEGVPKEINLNKLKKFMSNTEGVLDIHELHVWAISSDKISLTAHVLIDPQYEWDDVLYNLRSVLALQFNISHTTLQYERTKCLDGDSSCHFDQRSHKY